MCGSSYQPITRSGPVLRFAAIAAFGLTSSQVMYSTLTWTPVASWNFFVFWFQASSSALMNPLQRRRRNCASFSTGNIGLYFSCASDRVAAAARVPRPHCKTVRRRRVIGSLREAAIVVRAGATCQKRVRRMLRPMSAPGPDGRFAWEDPLHLDSQLAEDERHIRDM